MSRELDIKFRPELVAESAFVAPSAVVRGFVTIGAHSSVWFGAVVRGDSERVVIGERSNLQDLCLIHADPESPTLIGNDVTLGHAAIVHGATIQDGAMIGIRATVLNDAVIEAGALVGAHALVTEGTVIPAGHLAIGIPARVVRPLDEKNKARLRHAAEHYVKAAMRYAEG